jgi:hypothetical protein
VSDGTLVDIAATAVTVRRAAGNKPNKGGSGSLDWSLLAALLTISLRRRRAR